VPEADRIADVTVVIAAWNAARTLDAALASVAAQSIPPTAVVVADDASTDATVAVAEAWSSRLPIEVVRLMRNQGPGRARHAAIERATTELVAVLDADDVWMPDHLHAMLTAYRDRAGLITARPMFWVPGSALTVGPFTVPPADRQLRALLRGEIVVNLTLFARADYHAAGGYRDELRRGEDWDLWIRMVRGGVVIGAPPHATFAYRQAPGTLTVTDDNVGDNVTVLQYAVAEAVTDGERRDARRALRRARSVVALLDAYDHARNGRRGRARLRALRSLAGPRRVAARAGFMLIAPGTGARLRDRHRFDASRLVEQ